MVARPAAPVSSAHVRHEACASCGHRRRIVVGARGVWSLGGTWCAWPQQGTGGRAHHQHRASDRGARPPEWASRGVAPGTQLRAVARLRALSRRLEGRPAGPQRLRAPLRAPHVSWLAQHRREGLPAVARGRRRQDQREHRSRRDRLPRVCPARRLAACDLARGRSHGLPAGAARRSGVRARARRRQERVARALRGRAVRQPPRLRARGRLRRGTSLRQHDHRSRCRPRQGNARGGTRVRTRVLPAEQRDAHNRRRLRSGGHARARNPLFRHDSRRTGGAGTLAPSREADGVAAHRRRRRRRRARGDDRMAGACHSRRRDGGDRLRPRILLGARSPAAHHREEDRERGRRPLRARAPGRPRQHRRQAEARRVARHHHLRHRRVSRRGGPARAPLVLGQLRQLQDARARQRAQRHGGLAGPSGPHPSRHRDARRAQLDEAGSREAAGRPRR